MDECDRILLNTKTTYKLGSRLQKKTKSGKTESKYLLSVLPLFYINIIYRKNIKSPLPLHSFTPSLFTSSPHHLNTGLIRNIKPILFHEFTNHQIHELTSLLLTISFAPLISNSALTHSQTSN